MQRSNQAGHPRDGSATGIMQCSSWQHQRWVGRCGWRVGLESSGADSGACCALRAVGAGGLPSRQADADANPNRKPARKAVAAAQVAGHGLQAAGGRGQLESTQPGTHPNPTWQAARRALKAAACGALQGPAAARAPALLTLAFEMARVMQRRQPPTAGMVRARAWLKEVANGLPAHGRASAHSSMRIQPRGSARQQRLSMPLAPATRHGSQPTGNSGGGSDGDCGGDVGAAVAGGAHKALRGGGRRPAAFMPAGRQESARSALLLSRAAWQGWQEPGWQEPAGRTPAAAATTPSLTLRSSQAWARVFPASALALPALCSREWRARVHSSWWEQAGGHVRSALQPPSAPVPQRAFHSGQHRLDVVRRNSGSLDGGQALKQAGDQVGRQGGCGSEGGRGQGQLHA